MKWNIFNNRFEQFFIIKQNDCEAYLTRELDDSGPIRWWLKKHTAEVFPRNRLKDIDGIILRSWSDGYEIVWVNLYEVEKYTAGPETFYKLKRNELELVNE